MSDAGKLLDDFSSGFERAGKKMPEITQAFMGFLGAISKEGALSVKQKELISVGISAYSRCTYCISYHVHKALEAGATPEEIMEAAGVAISFGGGPSMAYTVTLLLDAIEEFSGDFK